MRGPATGTYEAPGKQAFRELLLSLAKETRCHSYGTFWGTGIDSRMFASEFDVIACEIVRAKHEAMAEDAANGGYLSHFGRAGRLTRHVDMFHADFDGGPSPSNFREVRRIASVTDRWLAVTLSMDHLHDESMMGEAAFYTLPAWLTGASGFTLEYLSRYKRNRFGQTMWTAILQRREGKGNSHRVQPLQIAYSVTQRRYWASRPMYRTHLLPHSNGPETEHERQTSATYYQEHRGEKLIAARTRYVADPDKAYRQHRGWVARNPERYRELQRLSAKRRREDPTVRAKRRAYHAAWYLRKKTVVSGTTAKAVSSEEAA